MDALKESFVKNKFISKHFENPEAAWAAAATVNNDGSKAIISKLTTISDSLDDARGKRLTEQMEEIRDEMLNELGNFYEPADSGSRNEKVKRMAGRIRRDLTRVVSKDPVAFGKVMECFLVDPEEMREVANRIIVLHTETPAQYSREDLVIIEAGVVKGDSREQNVRRLLNHYAFENEKELREYLAQDEIDLDDMLANRKRTLTTMEELVVYRLVEAWSDHLESRAGKLKEEMPNVGIILDMFKNLFDKLEMAHRMALRIKDYLVIFPRDEQPNVIGDYASLTFNKFVTTVGREFVDDITIGTLQEKARLCELTMDLSQEIWTRERKAQSLKNIFSIFERYSEIINNPNRYTEQLNQLPFWNNYQRWSNFLMMGLLLTSDISNVDPRANEEMSRIISETETLYK